MSNTLTAAQATLSLVDAALKNNLSSYLSQPGWEDVRRAFQDTARLLVRIGALHKTPDGWLVAPEALEKQGDEILAPIGAAGLAAAEALSLLPNPVQTLLANDQRNILEAALMAADAQAAVSGSSPDLQSLRTVLNSSVQPEQSNPSTPPQEPSTDSTAVNNSIATEPNLSVPRSVTAETPTLEQLHNVSAAALGFLEIFERVSVTVPNTQEGQYAIQLQDALETALRNSDYALPGEIFGRALPYAMQVPRGNRAQQMAIFEAACAYTDHLRTANLLQQMEIEAGDFAQTLARIEIERKFEKLETAIEQARTSPPMVLESPSDDAPSVAPESSSFLSQAQAKALLQLVDLASQITDSAQLDTLEYDMLMFSREHFKSLGESLKTIDQTGADLALSAAREEGQSLPGVSDESMKALTDLILDLRDIRLNATARGDDFVAVSQADIDSITRLTDQILYSGAREGIAVAAGESQTSPISLTEGRDSTAFSTIQEAVSRGSYQDNPENALHSMGKVFPEMDFSEWYALSPRQRATTQAVFIEPGKGDFEELQIAKDLGSFYDPRVEESQKKALRHFVRRRLLDDTPLPSGKGTVGERFRDRVLSARHRIIVAPTRGIAKAYREEGERIADELIRQKREAADIALSQLERVPLDFERTQVARFLRVVEAQGSTSAASLIKTGEHLIIAHPDGPTLKAEIGAVGSLAHHPDGHVIAKLPLESLRGAVETGQPKVRIIVTEDRVAGILGHTPTTQRIQTRHVTEKNSEIAA